MVVNTFKPMIYILALCRLGEAVFLLFAMCLSFNILDYYL